MPADDEKKRIIRRVHALAKEIWGDRKIGDIPAYIFWTRVWCKLRYGVELRRHLDITQWLEMEEWLKNLRKRRVQDGTKTNNL